MVNLKDKMDKKLKLNSTTGTEFLNTNAHNCNDRVTKRMSEELKCIGFLLCRNIGNHFPRRNQSARWGEEETRTEAIKMPRPYWLAFYQSVVLVVVDINPRGLSKKRSGAKCSVNDLLKTSPSPSICSACLFMASPSLSAVKKNLQDIGVCTSRQKRWIFNAFQKP